MVGRHNVGTRAHASRVVFDGRARLTDAITLAVRRKHPRSRYCLRKADVDKHLPIVFRNVRAPRRVRFFFISVVTFCNDKTRPKTSFKFQLLLKVKKTSPVKNFNSLCKTWHDSYKFSHSYSYILITSVRVIYLVWTVK